MTEREGVNPPESNAPGGSDPYAVAVRGLDHWFGEIRALASVDIDVPVGATLVVLGPNGSGKTTLTRILATLLRPSAGEVSVLGAGLPREAWRARGRVGYLGHLPLLYRDLSASENLSYHAALFGTDRETAAARIEVLLAATGMAAHGHRRVAEMSAGMTQRVDICRTLLHEPELLILDEPYAHLDESVATDLAGLIGPEPGRTRVIVTHDVDAGLEHGDLALVLDRSGRPAYAGPAAQISGAEVRRAYGRAEPGA